MITYDCFENGLQAVQIYQRLVQRFDQEFRFDADFWRFEVLAVPSVADRAAAIAAQADLVIIAIDGRHSLPAEFQVWVEKWIRQKAGQNSALGVLSRHPMEAVNGSVYLRAYFRGVAIRGGMALISGSIGWTRATERLFRKQLRPQGRQSHCAAEKMLSRSNPSLQWS